MQRSSYNAKNLNINQMRQTSYERGFDYVSCHEKFPLQLKGKMKKHSQGIIKDEIKSIINYESQTMDLKKNNNMENCRKGQSCHQIKNDNKQRNVLAQKILTNNKMSKENYQKSIVPSDDLRSFKQRPQSVKTYKQNRPGSGINYLLSSNQKNMYKNPQRRHVEEYHIPRRQSFGRKCNIVTQKLTQSSQIVECLNQTQPKINSGPKVPNDLKINSATFGVIHSSTTNKRISEDIHSSYANKETIDSNISVQTRYESRNQFKTGTQLGYEFKKSKQIATQKINQMIGNQGFWKKPNQTECLIRQKRDDWRRSAFVIQ